MTKIITLTLGLLIAGTISQCSNFSTSSSEKPVSKKSVSVSFGIATSSAFNSVAREAEVKVSSGDFEPIIQPMTLTDSMVYCTINNIPVGDDRTFEILVYDENGVIKYYGSRKLAIFADIQNTVDISIKSVAGSVVIIGRIDDTFDTTKCDSCYNPTDTTYYPDCCSDTGYTEPDSINPDSSVVGGACEYQEVVGKATFSKVVPINDSLSRAVYNFSAKGVDTKKNREIIIQNEKASTIKLHHPYVTHARYIVRGTCAPESYTIVGIQEFR